jgi:hypothetical protein
LLALLGAHHFLRFSRIRVKIGGWVDAITVLDTLQREQVRLLTLQGIEQRFFASEANFLTQYGPRYLLQRINIKIKE